LGSPDDKPGLEEHVKAVARVESWLDQGVLNALDEEAGYRRVDVTLVLQDDSDASTRRF
jgi:hypothetical protein